MIERPRAEQRARLRAIAERYERLRGRLDELRELPSVTRDGRAIRLSANIGGLFDLDLVKRYGAQGVGLLRTEILALSSRGLPERGRAAARLPAHRRAGGARSGHGALLRPGRRQGAAGRAAVRGEPAARLARDPHPARPARAVPRPAPRDRARERARQRARDAADDRRRSRRSRRRARSSTRSAASSARRRRRSAR